MLTNNIFFLANNKPKDFYSAINFYNVLIETINYLRSSHNYKESMKYYLELIKFSYSDRLNEYELKV